MSKEKLIEKVEEALLQIIKSGVPEKKIISQFDLFKQGFSQINLNRPCIHSDGIKIISSKKFDRLQHLFLSAVSQGRVMKFVPASGAATRMFKSLFALSNKYGKNDHKKWTNGEKKDDIDYLFEFNFIQSIKKFAFYEDLKLVLSKQGKTIDKLIEQKLYKDIIDGVLNSNGLNYGDSPKGLIKFHAYKNYERTALEEQIEEAACYTADKNGIARIHFTVLRKHQTSIEMHFSNIQNRYEKNGIKLEISFSVQNPETDTIAVDLKDKAYRTDKDELLFRPSGHGALLENLNDLKGDIIFIKNIDNVVPDHIKPNTYLYKKVLGGYLVELQDQIFYYLNVLYEKKVDGRIIETMVEFAKEKLMIFFPFDFGNFSREEKIEFIFAKFNRPIRVCGMVENLGEPGGGPFWVDSADNSKSIQIVEKSQIDFQSKSQRDIFHNSTHFNPVDVVCGVKNFKGESFDLIDFVDSKTGFITLKSKESKELKAMELPGLWNGSMAYWNTIFVEVPLITFNPVKTVNDLLKKEHQPKK